MTGVEGPESEVNQHDETDDTPGWGLPSAGPESIAPRATTGDNDAPLTEVQREVVNDVAKAQRELGAEGRWRSASTRNLFGGGFGGGMFAGEIDSVLASQAESRATASEREAQLLVGTSDSGSDAEPHFPAVARRHGRRSMRPKCIRGRTTGWPRPSNTTVSSVRLPGTRGRSLVRPTRKHSLRETAHSYAHARRRGLVARSRKHCSRSVPHEPHDVPRHPSESGRHESGDMETQRVVGSPDRIVEGIQRPGWIESHIDIWPGHPGLVWLTLLTPEYVELDISG